MTILFRNKLMVFESQFCSNPMNPLELVKGREIPFDHTPQVVNILSNKEIITGSSQEIVCLLVNKVIL